MLKLSCLLFLLMTCNCTPSRFSYPTPTTKDDCMQLFRDVLSIQEVRNRASDRINGWARLFEEGKIRPGKYRKKYHKWQTEENILRKRVTLMYDVGYAAGCFDENKQWQND